MIDVVGRPMRPWFRQIPPRGGARGDPRRPYSTSQGFSSRSRPAVLFVLASALLASGHPSPTAAAPQTNKPLRCDESLKTAFQPDPWTKVLDVKKYKKGEPYPNPTMEQQVYPRQPAKFAADLCMVKLLVGPGLPGPEGAPSTSRGIGLEVWLPEKGAWNHRVHAIGGSGTANGTEELIQDKISSGTGAGGDVRAAPRVAAEEGAVTSTTDNGQQVRSGAFMMNPDGSINAAGIRDWTYRGLFEQARKTKELATAYYGSPPKYAYFDGASGGGRQAHDVAQYLPEQYDGILSRVPAMQWSEFIAQLYPAVVIALDLGGKSPTKEQLERVSSAAVAACDVVGGQHLGFIIDNRRCRYDPTKDRTVLCAADGGASTNPDCLTRVQALAINKIWYGITSDGSVPDPAIDNGWDGPPSGVHRWYGLPRGSILTSLAIQTAGGGVGTEMVAVALGDPKLGSPGFKNATGDGENGWRKLNYAQLAAAFDRARALQPLYAISANNPDLSRLRDAGAKFLHVANVNDEAIYSQGQTDYFEQVAARMGGLAAIHSYYRLYMLPGLAHGPWNGTGNRMANPPMPARGQLYQALVDWVEKGTPPDHMVMSSSALGGEAAAIQTYPPPDGPAVSLPACSYPTAPTYVSGDIFQAASYVCK